MAEKWYPQLDSEDYKKPNYGRMHKGKAQVRTFKEHNAKSKALSKRRDK
jgi:hypothetical protein